MESLGAVLPYIWVLIAVASFALESATMQLVSVWFIPSSIVSLILSLFSIHPWIQMIVFLVLSVLLLVFVRPILSKLVFQKPMVPTNADRVIGMRVTVLTTIDPLQGTGEVRADGKVWSAKSFDGSVIPKGTSVQIVAIEGVKLLCQKAEVCADTCRHI